MAKVTLHNISDRPNTPGAPVSLVLGGQKLRPGGRLEIDDSVLNEKHRELHGTRIWIGKDLPGRFARTSRSALAIVAAQEKAAAENAPLTLEQARAYLAELDVEELREMAAAAAPPIEFPGTPSKAAIVSRFGRALFQPERELDPEVFFWLGRWTKTRGGYAPKE